MKMRKITAFITAVVAVVAALAIMPASKVLSYADESATVSFVQTYEYKDLYLVKKVLAAKGETYDEELTYKFTYGDVTSPEVNKNSTSKTRFKCALGDDVFTVYTVADGTDTMVAECTVGIVEKENVAEDSIKYVLDDAALADYNNEIKDEYSDLELDDKFYYPDLNDMLVSDYFDYDDLTKTVYYSKPSDTSFSSTTSKYFTLSELGTYSFYVVANDSLKQGKFAVDVSSLTSKDAADKNGTQCEGYYDENDQLKYLRKTDGWYTVSGTEETLVCPIFKFEFLNKKAPTVTVSKAENAYKGITYSDVKSMLTVVSVEDNVEYKLYYSKNNLKTSDIEDWVKDGVAIVENADNATDVTEKEECGFDASALTFTPDEEGYYYVVCKVADKYGSYYAVTQPILAKGGFREVTYESEFLKYNWVSMLFLGIALLSFIALLCVIFIKPKDAAEVEQDVKPVSKK